MKRRPRGNFEEFPPFRSNSLRELLTKGRLPGREKTSVVLRRAGGTVQNG